MFGFAKRMVKEHRKIVVVVVALRRSLLFL
jgi:hypothetical protein